MANPILDNFMSSNSGNRAEDYHYTYNKTGSKCYYSYLTGKRVAKNRIPECLHDKIQSKDCDLDLGELLQIKKGYLDEIKKLEAKVATLDLKITTLNRIGDEEILKMSQEKRREREERTQKRKIEMDAESREFLRRLFEEASRENPRQEVPLKKENIPPEGILSRLKITTRAEWRQWLLQYHPDKGGDSILCTEVITAGKEQGW